MVRNPPPSSLFKKCLLFGLPLQAAVEGQLWGPALLLACSLDSRAFQDTAAAMAQVSALLTCVQMVCNGGRFAIEHEPFCDRLSLFLGG